MTRDKIPAFVMLLLVFQPAFEASRRARLRCGSRRTLTIPTRPPTPSTSPTTSKTTEDDCYDCNYEQEISKYNAVIKCYEELLHLGRHHISAYYLQNPFLNCFPEQHKSYWDGMNYWYPHYEYHVVDSPNYDAPASAYHIPIDPPTPRGPCNAMYAQGTPTDGFVNTPLNGRMIQVYCEYNKHGGYDWLVFQRRKNNKLNFFGNWTSYEEGFSDQTNFWLGLGILHELTRADSYTLRVDLKDFDGNESYAEYSNFAIGSGSYSYPLFVSGYSGTAGDSLWYHNGFPFSTYDCDHDIHYRLRNCAVDTEGAWWYRSCYYANLNGKYFDTPTTSLKGIVWYTWKNRLYSLKETAMKMRINV